MRRGDVVIAAGGGGFGGKPRPYVVVQSDAYRATSLILVGCHGLVDDDRVPIRPLLAPTPRNGLRKPSEVTIDTPVTMRIDRIDQVIGHLDDSEMESIEIALLLMLGLADSGRV